MFKVLIIDDEAVVRRGLKAIIDWEKYDFCVCGEAIDGMDGLNKIKDLKPEVVFVDIKMPYMDGLQMMQEVKKLNIQCKIILLTGYAEFEYAKTAIAYGAKAYLLKPFDEDEIYKILLTMQRELSKEKTESEIILKNKNIIFEEAIHKILCGINKDTDEQLLNVINIFNSWSKFEVIIMTFDNDSILYENQNELKEKLNKYIIQNGYGYPFILSGRYGILLNGKWDEKNDESLQVIEKLRKVVSSLFNCNIRFLIGCDVYNIDDVRLSYEDACQLESNRFIYGKQNIIYSRKNISNISDETNKVNNGAVYFQYDNTVQKLYFAVTINNEEDIKNILCNISNSIIENGFSEEKVKYVYVELYKEVMKLITENDLVDGKNKLDDYDIVSHVLEQNYIEDLNQTILNRLKEISDKLFEAGSKYKINKLIGYVDRNYDKDLKLENFCESLYYSRSYIGKLFRTYTGQKFDVYVDLLRIEKAKELLLSGFKVYEVAKKVGFNNIDYFYSKFKKYTGVSPREYKSMIAK